MRILKNIGGVRGSESISRLVVSCYSYFICVNVLFYANVKILVFVVSYSGDFMYNQVWKPIPMIYRSSKCGPWTSSIRICVTWEPVRQANGQAPWQRYGSRITRGWGPVICVLISCLVSRVQPRLRATGQRDGKFPKTLPHVIPENFRWMGNLPVLNKK